jgi:hypothetical protein
MEKKTQIKKGDIFYYLFDEEENRHCKHGILVAHYKKNRKWRFNDTYWGKFNPDGEYGWYDENEIKNKIIYFGNTKQLKEINEYESYHYEDKDVLFIPIGGGSESWYVKKSAKKNIQYIRNQLLKEIEGLKNEINWNIRKIVEKEIKLETLTHK